MNNIIKSENKNINIGIQLLRTILSFNIVVFHCLDNKFNTKYIYFFCLMGVKYYVPTFFVISSYFSYKTFSSKNIIKLKERLLRIIIPYTIWPFIIWFKYSFISGWNGLEDNNKFKILFYQLLIGKPFLPVFWFHFCLIFWSIFFTILVLILKYTYNYILILLIILSVNINYFDYINILFKGIKDIILVAIKDLFKTIVYMVFGFFLGSKSILKRKIEIKIKIILISLINCLMINQSINKRKLFSLQILFISNIIFISFSTIPFEFIKNKNINSFLKQLTGFSGGIYYLHWEIKFRLMKSFILIKKGDFLSCIIIYLICYSFSFIMYNLFKNTKLKYMFI